MERLQLRDLMDLERDVLSTMPWDADSPNGEPCSRLEMDAQPRPPSKRPLTPSPDTDLSASRTDSCQSSSQRSSKMESMISRCALPSLREFSPQLCNNCSCNIFLLKVSSSSQIWLPQELHARPAQSQKRSPGTPLEPLADQLCQPSQVLCSSPEVSPRKKLP